jgi:hypothetical protein
MSDTSIGTGWNPARPKRRGGGGFGRDGNWLLPLFAIGFIGFVVTDAQGGGSCPLRQSPDVLAERVLDQYREIQVG